MRKFVSGFSLIASVAILSACNTAGTTYGTGTSHEEQTFKGLSNMFSLSADDDRDIEYKPRPDLVMPADKSSLPSPNSQSANVDQNWPVSPEQRIAAVRGGAPEPDRGGNLPTEYLTDTNKPGIANSTTRKSTTVRRGNDRAIGSGAELIDEIRADANGNGPGAEAQRRRDELSYATGVKRKFLTEPPTLYRTPSDNAEAGDVGITREQLSERQAAEKKQRDAIDRGTILPGS